MTDNDIVTMQCSECGHVVHERPDVFFGDFECPQCSHPAIFRRMREEALPRRESRRRIVEQTIGHIMSAVAGMRTAIRPKTLAGVAAAGMLLGLGVWFCGWRHAQDAKIDALSADLKARQHHETTIAALDTTFRVKLKEVLQTADPAEKYEKLVILHDETLKISQPLHARHEIDAAIMDVLEKAIEAERAYYADREQTVSEKVASAQDLQKAAMQMRKIVEQKEKALQARETAAESVLRREKQAKQLEENLARREVVLAALQKELAALKSEMTLREKAVAAREAKNARSEEHIMKMLTNLSEKKDPPKVVVVQSPAPRYPTSLMRFYTIEYGGWNSWRLPDGFYKRPIYRKKIPVHKRPVKHHHSHKTPAAHKTLSKISLVAK